MKLAKINQGRVVEYPLTIQDLRLNYPRVSFPKNLNSEAIKPFNVVIVKEVDKPEVDHTKNISEGSPRWDGTSWVQTWVVTQATSEEIERRTKLPKIDRLINKLNELNILTENDLIDLE